MSSLKNFAAQMALDANGHDAKAVMGWAIGLCGTCIYGITNDRPAAMEFCERASDLVSEILAKCASRIHKEEAKV